MVTFGYVNFLMGLESTIKKMTCNFYQIARTHASVKQSLQCVPDWSVSSANSLVCLTTTFGVN